jgi:hypothetical protein
VRVPSRSVPVSGCVLLSVHVVYRVVEHLLDRFVPFGAFRDGQCEIGEKRCIWVKAYERTKPYGEDNDLLEGPVVFKNGALSGTSAWANTFLDRDHNAPGRKENSD